MARYLCAWLPFFRTQRLTRAAQAPEQTPLAVIERRGNTALLAAASPAAQAAGVQAGMTLAQARAILPALATAELNETAEAAALEALAAFVYSFSPRVMLLPPQALILDITGCERLHGGEEQLLRKLVSGFERLGYTACLAIADNATAACALAMSGGRQSIALPGATVEALDELPLPALRLDERTTQRLSLLGIRGAGQLLSLPAEALPARFGDDLALRVRQLRGEALESFETWKPVQHIAERLDFTGATDRFESLMFALRKAATFLSERLDAAAAGARRIEARFAATEGAPLAFTIDTSRPVGDAKSLATLLTGRFENVDTGERWYEAVELIVPSREPLAQRQQEMFGAAPGASRKLNELIDELAGRLGPQAAMRAELTDNPVPEESYRYVPFDTRTTPAGGPGEQRQQRPARIAFADYERVAVELDQLPAHWNFAANNTRLRVCGDVERITLAGPRDYMTIEDGQGAQHFCWFTPGAFWVPPPLLSHVADLRRLAECGVTRASSSDGARVGPPLYAELVCATNFSFLRGASHAEDLVREAADRGLRALAITDLHTLAGVVRAHAAAKQRGLKLLIGTRVKLVDGPELCLYAMNREGYGRLCRLLTTGKRRAEKGECRLFTTDLVGTQRAASPEHAASLQAVLLNGGSLADEQIASLKQAFGDRLSLAISAHMQAGDSRRVADALALATRHGIAPVAVNDVFWHDDALKPLQDVLACIRGGTTLDEGVALLFPNGERRIKSPDEVAAMFSDTPQAVARSAEIADSCTFSLDELRYEYPSEAAPAGMSMQDYLVQETWAGAARRYPQGVPDAVREQIARELELINELNYAAYFLTVYDIVRYARSIGIHCQGRGSAANSSVCFSLGITEVDPSRITLVCERFISRERNEPPDIDVDFEHERREEVIQYIYQKYGRERAGLCATVISYRFRSSVREVGKVMGLSLDQVDRLAKGHGWWEKGDAIEEVLRTAGLDPADGRVRRTIELASQLRGYPRHLSQHVGGFVITRGRLDELVPIENAAMEDRTVIEWNKDDIEELGILKVDCLSLGMLTAIRKTFAMVEGAGGRKLSTQAVFACDPTGEGVTPEAKAIYAMLQKADAVGTFQVESRAQMSMLPRLKPKKFYDLVVEVAIVRPGPIQGGMVHPYLRRVNGEEPVDYPHPSLIPVLQATLGIPLFQEQAMRLAVVAAGYAPGEADQLRRSMGSWGRTGEFEVHRARLLRGMRERGISEEYAKRVISQIEGFAAYGFPESHAASFALITFVSCYLKRFYPAAFTAGLINSQPMGFYSVASLVRDAREHGVEVKPPCINASDTDCTLEGAEYPPAPLDAPPTEWGKNGPALRLGLRLIKGLGSEFTDAVAQERRERGAYADVNDVVRRARRLAISGRGVQDALTKLAAADAFACFGISRREALWQVAGSAGAVPEMFNGLDAIERAVELPALTDMEATAADYATRQLTLGQHPLALIRHELADDDVAEAAALLDAANGATLSIAGLVLNRQRPSTAKGIMFMTLEDETGTANVVIHPRVFREFRSIAMSGNSLIVEGKVERRGDVIHLIAKAFRPVEGLSVTARSRDFH